MDIGDWSSVCGILKELDMTEHTNRQVVFTIKKNLHVSGPMQFKVNCTATLAQQAPAEPLLVLQASCASSTPVLVTLHHDCLCS